MPSGLSLATCWCTLKTVLDFLARPIMNPTKLSVTLQLHDDNVIDVAIVDWLGTHPTRVENAPRGRVYRYGINNEIKLALYSYIMSLQGQPVDVKKYLFSQLNQVSSSVISKPGFPTKPSTNQLESSLPIAADMPYGGAPVFADPTSAISDGADKVVEPAVRKRITFG